MYLVEKALGHQKSSFDPSALVKAVQLVTPLGKGTILFINIYSFNTSCICTAFVSVCIIFV